MAFLESSSNYVGGSLKKSSSLGTSKSSNQETLLFSNISTLIVELYLQTARGYSAFGLRSSSTEISSDTDYNKYGRCSWKEPDNSSYCFDNPSNTILNSMYASYTMGDNPRRVFVFHNWQNGQMSIYPAHLSYGPKSASSPFVSTAYIGTSNGLMNDWVTHTDGDGNIYKSITVDSNSKFIGTTLSVVKGKKYTFNMHTVSEGGYDGIIISESSMTSGSVTNSGIAYCSGVDVTSEYTYTPTSDRTIYIYFITDSSGLSNKYETTDSNGSTITKGFTTGDIKIIAESAVATTTIILDPNDGTISGLKTTSIRYGANVSDIRVSSLPEKTGCKFKGYYTGSSRNNPGTMYIDSNGRGVSGLTWDIKDSTYTLYALYEYTGNIVLSWNSLHCVYCTSSAASASTLQASAQITLGEISSIIAGEFTCSQLNTSASNHLGNLTMTNDKKTVTIPGGISRGDYIFEIKYTFTPDDTSVFIKEDTKKCEIWIIPTYIVRETMELPSPVPDSLVQKEDIPAGSFTLNNNNLSDYFRYPGIIPSTTQVTYNNGKTASSTPQITWSMYQPITFNSLGTTITSRGLVAIPNGSFIIMEVKNRRYHGSCYDNRTKVIEIISDALQKDDVGYYSQFKDIGVDSLNYVDIVNGIETAYNILIPIGDLKYIYSVDLLCKYLYKFYEIGNGLQSDATIVPPFISASYDNNRVYREANEVTNLHISVTKNPIDAGETTTCNTTADFTSGDSANVNGSETFSNYDASIIQIDNT